MGCGDSQPVPSPSLQPKPPSAIPSPEASAHEEAAPEGDFKIQLEKTTGSDKMGAIVVSPDDEILVVRSVKEQGMIPDWNKRNENAPELQVKPGDLILSINGIF